MAGFAAVGTVTHTHTHTHTHTSSSDARAVRCHAALATTRRPRLSATRCPAPWCNRNNSSSNNNSSSSAPSPAQPENTVVTPCLLVFLLRPCLSFLPSSLTPRHRPSSSSSSFSSTLPDPAAAHLRLPSSRRTVSSRSPRSESRPTSDSSRLALARRCPASVSLHT